MNINIPVRFKILGQTIEVVERSDLESWEGLYGKCYYNQNRIEIIPRTNPPSVPETQRMLVLWHEITHLVLFHAGVPTKGVPLKDDEAFIERLAGLYHQVFLTMEEEHDDISR